MRTEDSTLPFVSVIMPVRNEAAFIERSVGAVLQQDYPPERMEVIVADGMSNDGTRELLNKMQIQYPQLRVIDNAAKVVPTGLNAALRTAVGEIVIRVDGHSIVASDFVSQDVAALAEHPEAWSVGGPIAHQASTPFGKAVAIAMSHRLGVGNANHHFAGFEGYGDGVPFPAIRRWVFERVGEFDECLVRNNDDEFNYRMTQAGGKIYITPHVRYSYFVRERPLQLYRQYFQYGFWRIPVMKKHKRPTTVRQVVPSLFYLGMTLLLLLGIVSREPLIALALPSLYLAVLAIVSFSVFPRTGIGVAFRLPAAIGIMHAGYAFGLLYGIAASFLRLRAWELDGQMTVISR